MIGGLVPKDFAWPELVPCGTPIWDIEAASESRLRHVGTSVFSFFSGLGGANSLFLGSPEVSYTYPWGRHIFRVHPDHMVYTLFRRHG